MMGRGTFLGLTEDELGPTKSELLTLLKDHTIKQIADKYQVTADAVRGWCAVFQVPPKRQKPEKLEEGPNLPQRRPAVRRLPRHLPPYR